MAHGIHPAILDHGLVPALESLVTRSSLPVSLTVETRDRLPETIEKAAYFVASEALANIGKHANASRAWIRLVRDDAVVLIAIEDDRIGAQRARMGRGCEVSRIESKRSAVVWTSSAREAAEPP